MAHHAGRAGPSRRVDGPRPRTFEQVGLEAGLESAYVWGWAELRGWAGGRGGLWVARKRGGQRGAAAHLHDIKGRGDDGAGHTAKAGVSQYSSPPSSSPILRTFQSHSRPHPAHTTSTLMHSRSSKRVLPPLQLLVRLGEVQRLAHARAGW
jgi:hypothetical protein